MTAKELWAEGKAAKEAGKTLDDCPYGGDERPCEAIWKKGWKGEPVTDLDLASLLRWSIKPN